MITKEELYNRVLKNINLRLFNSELKEFYKEFKVKKDFERFKERVLRFLEEGEWYFSYEQPPFRFAHTAVREYLKGQLESKSPEKVAEEFVGFIDELFRKQVSKGGLAMAALKNAKQYTEKLDKIAEEIQSYAPEFAYMIDAVSDVIEGRREASTLMFDADEARYMANRFNFNVRQRDADEPYMDNFNKSNFEQIIDAKRNPVPIRVAYKKVSE